MPDQNDTPPTKRMTTAEVAALAQQIDSRLDDLSAVVTDVSTRLQDIGSGSTSGAPTGPTADQVDARIHEALEPLHDEVHTLRGQLAAVESPSGTGIESSLGARLDGTLARLEDVERKLAATDPGALAERVATELHPAVADLRKRLDAVEEFAKTLDADPVSHTLAEDALADQVQAAVDRALADISTASDANHSRMEQLVREFADLRQHVETHGTRVTNALVAEVAASLPASVAPTVGGLGASRKVLQVMRAVTHIAKEKEANLGKGGRFNFRGVDDAMDAVGHAMREVGLTLSTEILDRETTLTPITQSGTDNGKPWERTVVWATSVVTARYTFIDPEDGSTHPFEMVGEGRDSSDKSTSKATSMAIKYGLFQALMIPVNGLDDADEAPPQTMATTQRPADTTANPRQQTSAPAPQSERVGEEKAARGRDALNAIRNVYRVEGGPQAQYNRLVQIMQQVSSEGLLDLAVEGSTLNQHGEAAMRTLQAPPPPDDARASTEPPEPPDGY